MNEAEWLDCTDPQKMLEFLKGKASDRKVRLFAAACVRRVWHLLTDARSRDAVEGAERYGDGHLNEGDFLAVFLSAANALDGMSGRPAVYAASAACASVRWVFADENHTQLGPGEPFSDAQLTAKQAARAFHPDTARQQAAQTSLVLDIFGDPFRPIALDPAWHTSTVVALAHATYDHRILPAGTLEPARLAVLADALEEAGCQDDAILGHLRGPGPHVRGCHLRFVDCQYRPPEGGDSTSRGSAEPDRQLLNHADAISAEGGSLLKRNPTRKGRPSSPRECKGLNGGNSGT